MRAKSSLLYCRKAGGDCSQAMTCGRNAAHFDEIDGTIMRRLGERAFGPGWRLEMATRLDKSAATISGWESGQTRIPSLEQNAIQHICAFEVMRSRPIGEVTSHIEGRAILIAEDNAVIAMDLANILTDAGASIVGPAHCTIDGARLVQLHRIDAAVLDIKLSDGLVWPLATELTARAVPTMLVSGLSRDPVAVPPHLSALIRIDKPYRAEDVLSALATALEISDAAAA